MKIKTKMTIVLVVAMVMTISMVAVAYAYYAPAPAWNQGTGRYTQVYEMNVGYNWKFTKDVDACAALAKNIHRGMHWFNVHPMV